MKNMKKFLLIVFTVLTLFNMEGVSADGEMCYCRLNDEGSNCHTRTYQYDRYGKVHWSGASVVLGVRHFKETISNNPNQQFVTAFDDCYGGTTSNQFCGTLKRFQIFGNSSDCSNSNTTYMDVNSNTYIYPMAICAFPHYDEDYQGVYYDNASQYIYYTQADIDKAINNDWCYFSDLLYSSEAINEIKEKEEAEALACAKQTTLYTFTPKNGNTNLKISTQSHTAGQQKICQVKIYTADMKEHITDYVHYDYTGSCSSSSYKLDCSGVSHSEPCYLKLCEPDENAGVTEEDKGEEVGFKCTLTNEEDSSDKVTVSYVDEDKIKNKVENPNTHYGFYFARNNEIIKESVSDRTEDNPSGCPTHIYYDKTDRRWIIFPSQSDVQIFLNDPDTSNGGKFIDHEFIRFSLNGVSDQETLYEEDVNDKGMPNDFTVDPDDYEYGGKYHCGMFGDKTWGYIQKLYMLVRIAIPAAVIILGMIDFATVVFSGEDKDMKASGQRFLKRVIIGIVLILLPYLLQFIFDLVNFSKDCLGDLIS